MLTANHPYRYATYSKIMELREYITIIQRYLWLIILGTGLAGGTAFIVSKLMTPVYEASAGVVVAKSGFQLELEPRFKTLTEEELARLGASQVAAREQRNTLAAIAKNESIAAPVFEKLENTLPDNIKTPDDLVGLIDSTAEGDLIRITARHSDPQFAAGLANAWAQSYAQYINRIYGGQIAPTDIEQQVLQAQQTYEATQAKLVDFIRSDQLGTAERQLQQEQADLAKLEYGIAESPGRSFGAHVI